jgi:hypothetical protein
MVKDISYKDYKKKSDIHGTILYPATMIAPVQHDFLTAIMTSESIESVFDPFFGSGTSLYEAMLVDDRVKLVGCDINPLAYLITEAKLKGIDTDYIDENIDQLQEKIATIDADEYTFTSIDKWFREDIANDLRIIRQSIMSIENEKNRKYFWCMLSDIVRRFSNSRSSTYKLHIKEKDRIDCMENIVKEAFLKSVNENQYFFNHHSDNIELYKQDILLKISEFVDNKFDISITSPPYGDNATTVTYGQFSSLSLKWIDTKDLHLEGWELENYSIIDSKSLGGIVRDVCLNEQQANILKPYLSEIAESKQRKVFLFFEDYFKFLDELCRVTKKYIVMTLGNRRVDNKLINLTDITYQYLDMKDFTNISKATRKIPQKRMPQTTSSVRDESVSSMNEEYVLVHKRRKNNF